MNNQTLHGMIADLQLSVQEAFTYANGILGCVLLRIKDMDLQSGKDVRQLRDAECALWGLHQLMECNDRRIESEFNNVLDTIKTEGGLHSAAE